MQNTTSHGTEKLMRTEQKKNRKTKKTNALKLMRWEFQIHTNKTMSKLFFFAFQNCHAICVFPRNGSIRTHKKYIGHDYCMLSCDHGQRRPRPVHVNYLREVRLTPCHLFHLKDASHFRSVFGLLVEHP